MRVHTANSNGQTLHCQCSLFSKKNPIIQIFCISGWLAIPINLDKCSSTVLAICYHVLPPFFAVYKRKIKVTPVIHPHYSVINWLTSMTMLTDTQHTHTTVTSHLPYENWTLWSNAMFTHKFSNDSKDWSNIRMELYYRLVQLLLQLHVLYIPIFVFDQAANTVCNLQQCTSLNCSSHMINSRMMIYT